MIIFSPLFLQVSCGYLGAAAKLMMTSSAVKWAWERVCTNVTRRKKYKKLDAFFDSTLVQSNHNVLKCRCELSYRVNRYMHSELLRINCFRMDRSNIELLNYKLSINFPEKVRILLDRIIETHAHHTYSCLMACWLNQGLEKTTKVVKIWHLRNNITAS